MIMWQGLKGELREACQEETGNKNAFSSAGNTLLSNTTLTRDAARLFQLTEQKKTCSHTAKIDSVLSPSSQLYNPGASPRRKKLCLTNTLVLFGDRGTLAQTADIRSKTVFFITFSSSSSSQADELWCCSLVYPIRVVSTTSECFSFCVIIRITNRNEETRVNMHSVLLGESIQLFVLHAVQVCVFSAPLTKQHP